MICHTWKQQGDNLTIVTKTSTKNETNNYDSKKKTQKILCIEKKIYIYIYGTMP